MNCKRLLRWLTSLSGLLVGLLVEEDGFFEFGVGGLYGRPTGGNVATPSGPQIFGTIQDVSVEFDQKLVDLRGQLKGPDDVAPSDMTIKGKSGFGRIEVEIYNSLFFGGASTISAGIKKVPPYPGEAQTVPASPGPYTVTVTNSADFINDLGVKYASTGGQLWQVAAGGEGKGKYSVVESGSGKGVYTFSSDDAGAELLFFYAYTDSADGETMLVTNQLQGYGPIFELYLMMPYQGNNGLHLFQCRASKMSAPMKRDGYLISDFEFESYQNAAGQWFEWFQQNQGN